MSSTEIRPGTLIEVRDAFGVWHPKIARSVPRLQYREELINRRSDVPYMIVRVVCGDNEVNWPLDDVRLAAGGVS